MISKGLSTVSFEQFRESTPDTWVAQNYLGITQLPVLVNSPLRKDKHKSFSIYLTEKGNVRFLDFAKGDRGDIYDLLAALWNTDRYNAISRVRMECKGLGSSTIYLRSINSYRKKNSNCSIEVIKRDWSQDDYDYWDSYGINKEWLEFGNIFPISRVLMTRDDERKWFPCDKLAYVYVENKDNKQTLKVYQPLNPQFKWMGKMSSDVWNLWEQLPQTGDLLIIASSRKDSLTIWANTGIPSTSLQSEGAIPKQQVIDELKERFKHIVFWYDNDYNNPDNPGISYAQSLSDKFDIPYIYIPSEYEAKDQSDFVKKWGKYEFYMLTKSLLGDLWKTR